MDGRLSSSLRYAYSDVQSLLLFYLRYWPDWNLQGLLESDAFGMSKVQVKPQLPAAITFAICPPLDFSKLQPDGRDSKGEEATETMSVENHKPNTPPTVFEISSVNTGQQQQLSVSSHHYFLNLSWAYLKVYIWQNSSAISDVFVLLLFYRQW